MRTRKSIKNIVTAVIGQLLLLIINFITRRYFVKNLGLEILGINGLFSNIISMMTLVESGIGISMIYSLYKPVHDEDYEAIGNLLGHYRKIYKKICIILISIFILSIPFLNVFIDTDIEFNEILIIYFVFFLTMLINYIFYYKRTLFIAMQNNYIINSIHYSISIIANVIQIIVLISFKNYLIYLIIILLFRLLENFLINFIFRNKYKYVIVNRNPVIDKVKSNEIKKNVQALALHKFGSVILNGTDNLIISYMLGLYWVGLYSNYVTIIGALTIIVSFIFNSITPSIGNFIQSKNEDEIYSLFSKIQFINFWLVGFVASSYFMLSNDFVTVWLGKDYLLDNKVNIALTLSFILVNLRLCVLTFKDAYGIYRPDRFKPLIEGLLNLVLSIILGYYLGLLGIFLGTIFSNIFTTFWIEPKVLFKFGINHKLKDYYHNYLRYSICIIISFFVSFFVLKLINQVSILYFIIKIIIIIILYNFIYLLLIFKDKNFIILYGYIKSQVKIFFNNKKKNT